MGKFLLTLLMSTLLFSASDAMRSLTKNNNDYAMKPPLAPLGNIRFFKVEIAHYDKKLIEFVKFRKAVSINRRLYSFINVVKGCYLNGIPIINDLCLDPEMTDEEFFFNIASAFGSGRYEYIPTKDYMFKESFERNYLFFHRNREETVDKSRIQTNKG